MKKTKNQKVSYAISPENVTFIKEFQELSGMKNDLVFDFLIFVAQQEIGPMIQDMKEIKKDNPHLGYAELLNAIDEKYENCPVCNPFTQTMN